MQSTLSLNQSLFGDRCALNIHNTNFGFCTTGGSSSSATAKRCVRLDVSYSVYIVVNIIQYNRFSENVFKFKPIFHWNLAT